MWFIVFLLLWPQTPPELDFNAYRAHVEPLLLEKRPGHARCVVCHSTGTAFRLQPLPKGQAAYSEEASRKNFDMVKKFVRAGHPDESRLLLMPLAHEAGGTEFHPGGKHWETRDDPEWKTLADWVNGGR
ncbi:MAG TPA: hypothetical protein VFA27_15095 [Vicinamibacterales bacterium]|nr:hypothetical protein [Vicinamibacterales bacterium]